MRKNETATILNRNVFEQCPPNTDPIKWNYFRRRYNAASALVITPNGPAQIDIELNSTCNLRCTFCIQSTKKVNPVFMFFGTFKQIINEAIQMGTYSCKLNYMNEPLLNKDLEAYIQYAKEAGMVNIFFSTNAILLTPERAEKLILSGVTKIFVSIDATNADTYKKLRNSDSYDTCIRNLKHFIYVRNLMGLVLPYVRVNFLKNKININEEAQFIEQWTDVADSIAIQEMNEVIGIESDVFIPPTKEVEPCSFPFKQLVVNASGDILPCCTMYGAALPLGNIRTMSLLEAWDCQRINELRDLHRANNGNFNPICKRCKNGA